MTSAIMNPLHGEVKTAIMAADVLNGRTRTVRPGSPPTATPARPARVPVVAVVVAAVVPLPPAADPRQRRR